MRLGLLLVATLAASCAGTSIDGSGDVGLTDEGIADAKADAPTTTSALTSAQAHQILTMIDDSCGDAWCEGDFNFAFKRFTCKTATHSCTMTVIVIDAGDKTLGTKTRRLWRSCKMPGFHQFTDIVDTAANGFQSLSDSYWSKIDACMTKIEDSVPPR